MILNFHVSLLGHSGVGYYSHVHEDLADRRLLAGLVILRIFSGVTMPAAQVVIAKDALTVSNKCKVRPVVFGIVEDVDQRVFVQFNAYFESITLAFNNSEHCVGESCGAFMPDSLLKQRQFLFRIQGLWRSINSIKLSQSDKQIVFFLLARFPLHKVTLDLVRVCVRNFSLLPGLGELSER